MVFTRTSNVFPDGPTETGHNGVASGEHKARNRTWGSHRACVSPVCVISPPRSAPYGSSIRESFIETILPAPSLPLPTPRSVRCYPLFPRFAPILTVSLITGAIRVGWTVLVHLTAFWRFEVARRLETVWTLWRRGGNLARLALLSKWTDT